MKQFLRLSAIIFGASILLTSCKSKERSSSTGWVYNDPKWGGFEKYEGKGQEAGPNQVLVQGGTFLMGQSQENITYDWDNMPRRVTVSSFYMDQTEVSNINYREYLYWLSRVFDRNDIYKVYQEALPDTLVWREELSYNEPYVETYFRHPSFDNYPVVGVNWVQANEFCLWRTDRVNEMILIEEGILNQSEQKNENNFNTEAYLAGQYEGSVRKNLKDLNTGEGRAVRFEDGILLPKYRLPTEAEWEYAALALYGKRKSENDELLEGRRIYPWDGNTVRYQKRDKYQGQMLANFKRGRGDYMGISGRLNDQASIPGPVESFMPNDFGLYNMAGNVAEWTADVYRPMTSTTLTDSENNDLNPFRGNKFETRVVDENGSPVEKDSLGRMRYREVTAEETATRQNYRTSRVYDYLDGDSLSLAMYDTTTTLVRNEARVIKGGSWADRAYWLSPGERRFRNQKDADRTIGFRCAMTRMGAPDGNQGYGANTFQTGGKKKRN